MAGTLRQAMVFLGLADDGYEQQPAPQKRRPEPEAEQDPEPAEPFQEEPEYEPAPVQQPAPRRASRQPERQAAVLEPVGEPEPEDDVEPPAEQPEHRAPVTPIKRAEAQSESDNELRRITTIHPRSYKDAKVIGESFRDNIPVIMNVTDMDVSEAKRLIDFSSGLTFALNGSIERVTEQVFLLTPANLEVLANDVAESGYEHEEVPVFNQR
jgi:cell division inhibitor SepF